MTLINTEGLEYLKFSSMDGNKIVHGIFTRKGGISPQPWASLNLGGTVGDTRENVIENRQRIYQVMGRPVESIFDVWQVHSADVICTDNPRPLNAPHEKADAILTNKPDVTLFMRFADCVPILLHDPVCKVVGIVHAGWMGTVNKVLAQTIQTMNEKYGSNPGDIIAGIGPSIGPDHYQVGEDVIEKVKIAFSSQAEELLINLNGRTYFNLWRANGILLQNAGVTSIEFSGLCTACDTSRWYSHRAEAGITGRFGAFISLV